MGRRGPKRQLDVEARYWELLAAGVGTVEACRAVGITRKTGYRWRAERGGLAPLELPRPPGRTGTFQSRNADGSPRCAARSSGSVRSPAASAATPGR